MPPDRGTGTPLRISDVPVAALVEPEDVLKKHMVAGWQPMQPRRSAISCASSTTAFHRAIASRLLRIRLTTHLTEVDPQVMPLHPVHP